MLLWYIRFRQFQLSPAQCIQLARAAIETNRVLGRNKYHPVRVGDIIIP